MEAIALSLTEIRSPRSLHDVQRINVSTKAPPLICSASHEWKGSEVRHKALCAGNSEETHRTSACYCVLSQL